MATEAETKWREAALAETKARWDVEDEEKAAEAAGESGEHRKRLARDAVTAAVGAAVGTVVATLLAVLLHRKTR